MQALLQAEAPAHGHACLAGAGKSMRAKRMQKILCDGWIKGSGQSSEKVRSVAARPAPRLMG